MALEARARRDRAGLLRRLLLLGLLVAGAGDLLAERGELGAAARELVLGRGERRFRLFLRLARAGEVVARRGEPRLGILDLGRAVALLLQRRLELLALVADLLRLLAPRLVKRGLLLRGVEEGAPAADRGERHQDHKPPVGGDRRSTRHQPIPWREARKD